MVDPSKCNDIANDLRAHCMANFKVTKHLFVRSDWEVPQQGQSLSQVELMD